MSMLIDLLRRLSRAIRDCGVGLMMPRTGT
jgi:hypothetical protein